MVLNRYISNSTLHGVLKGFVDSKHYEFTLNDSQKIVEVHLNGRTLATVLERGTVVSMNVFVEHLAAEESQRSRVLCPLCECALPILSDGVGRVLW
jgi:hypothetical protein